MNKLTAIIVSFYRIEYLEKCLGSMREQYPNINIIVGNNGPDDIQKEKLCKKYNAKYTKLPYDCGVCIARNELVKQVKTDYFLVGDDDFYYERESNLYKMFELFKGGSYDIIGGRIREGEMVKNYQGFIHDMGDHLEYEKLEIDENKKLYKCDLIFNFFIARTDLGVKWDEKIKVAYEHSTYFLDVKKVGGKVGFFKDSIVTHKPPITIHNKAEYDKYKEYRNRKNDRKRFFEKFDIKYTITMNGNKDVYDSTGMDRIDFLITTFERKECLERLLFSIAEHCKNAHISIADQSRIFNVTYYKDLWIKLDRAGLVHKPNAYNCGFDTGLSYCRNFLVGKTRREYKLILEDDFIFNKDTKIYEMLEVLENNDKYGIIGGAVKENGDELDFVHDFEIDGDTLYHRDVNRDSPLGIECDCIPNFFLANSKVFEYVLWDELIKINGEHTDFFLRLYSVGVRILYNNNIEIEHYKPRDLNYKKFRDRKEGLIRLLSKHNLKRMIYRNGHCYELDVENIKSYSHYNK